LGDLEKEN
jgi:hypothetical protein